MVTGFACFDDLVSFYSFYLKRQMNLPIIHDFLKLTDFKLDEWLNRSATRVTLDLVRFITAQKLF